MLKSISNLKGTKKLTKDQLKNIAGGILPIEEGKTWRIICSHTDGSHWWTLSAANVTQAVSLSRYCEANGGSFSVSMY
ncbi:MAG: hypothetical protein ACI9Y7_001337 [Dokdonia sp.]|jgi:hypothetical protein